MQHRDLEGIRVIGPAIIQNQNSQSFRRPEGDNGRANTK
jgi:hypothetical protein